MGGAGERFLFQVGILGELGVERKEGLVEEGGSGAESEEVVPVNRRRAEATDRRVTRDEG